jgi:peptidoglycan/LPS O-acetylase OafA/YrhL
MRLPQGEVRTELRALTALRFVAAMLVFVYHCPVTSGFGSQYTLGQAGVGFFFVLSGFILLYAYHRVFAADVGWTVVRNFYAARVARVYPAYLLATLIALPVLFVCGDFQWNLSTPAMRGLAFVAQILLIQAWIPVGPIILGINAPAWSVSTEAFFYVVFPFAAHWLLKHFRAAQAWKIGAVAVMIWVVPMAVFSVPHAFSNWETYIFPPVRLVDFCVGMVCAILYLKLSHRSEGRGWWTALEVVAIGAVAGSIAVSPGLSEAVRYTLLLVPSWALLITVMACGGGWVSRWLSAPICVHLGEISYSFYLLHASVIAAFVRAPNQFAPLTGAYMLAITLAGSFVMYHAVERPLRGRLRNALSTRPGTSAGPKPVRPVLRAG